MPPSLAVRTARRSLPALLTSLIALLALAPAASAQVWNETGDAGDLPATAQVTVGTGALTTINGTLSSATDVDMYCIDVLNPGSLLVGLNCVVNLGPNVYLFDASGIGLAATTLCSGGDKAINGIYVPVPGSYYVAVAYAGVDPCSGGGAIWTPNVIAPERAPDGPGGTGALTSWVGTGNVQPLNPYTITLLDVGFCGAPTPARAHTWGRVKMMYR